MVTQLKDAVHELEEKPKSQQEIRENAEKTNSAIYEFINLVVGHGVHPMLVQNVLLYYWLRCSTIRANADERLFQKIERNWPEIVEKFNSAYLDFIKKFT